MFIFSHVWYGFIFNCFILRQFSHIFVTCMMLIFIPHIFVFNFLSLFLTRLIDFHIYFSQFYYSRRQFTPWFISCHTLIFIFHMIISTLVWSHDYFFYPLHFSRVRHTRLFFHVLFFLTIHWFSRVHLSTLCKRVWVFLFVFIFFTHFPTKLWEIQERWVTQSWIFTLLMFIFRPDQLIFGNRRWFIDFHMFIFDIYSHIIL